MLSAQGSAVNGEIQLMVIFLFWKAHHNRMYVLYSQLKDMCLFLFLIAGSQLVVLVFYRRLLLLLCIHYRNQLQLRFVMLCVGR